MQRHVAREGGHVRQSLEIRYHEPRSPGLEEARKNLTWEALEET